MLPWWRQWPGLLKKELQALKRSGIPYSVDRGAFKKNNVVIIQVQKTVNGTTYSLEAVYPDYYPFTRFEVYASDSGLSRHIHYFEKNLCLLGRDTQNWSVSDTLADVLHEQLSKLFTDDPAKLATFEEPQAEPFTEYYSYQLNSSLLVDSSWSFDKSIDSGMLEICGEIGPGAIGEQRDYIFQGAVLQLTTANNTQLATIDSKIAQLYPRKFEGRWYRINAPIKENDPKIFLAELRKLHPSSAHARWSSVKNSSLRIAITGVVFDDEISLGNFGDGWIFIIRIQSGKHHREEKPFFVRACRAGKKDLFARIPEVEAISTKTIGTVGLGSIGAATAIEFARNGTGELRVMDFDYVEPGTTVRWPLGSSYYGFLKTMAIKHFIDNNYPYTNVQACNHRIGGIRRRDSAESDLDVMNRFFDGLALVYDATAEFGIQYLLSELARERQIPYIYAATKQGAWGGIIARFRPGITEGCWVCLQKALAKGKLPTPIAATDVSGRVQPDGCAALTFTGANFDIAEIVATAVRTCVSTICAQNETGYPETDWDLAILTLRDQAGNLLPPRWDSYRIERHPECQNHTNH